MDLKFKNHDTNGCFGKFPGQAIYDNKTLLIRIQIVKKKNGCFV